MPIKKLLILIGILGAIQFLVLTTYAMWLYPGGTIHNASLDSYDFWMNYFSDLGRTHTFDRTPNWACHYLFKTSITISGICIVLFFSTLVSFFAAPFTKFLAVVATFFGMAAGVFYVALAWLPYDVYFYEHRYAVQVGFVAFLLMSMFYAAAVFQEKKYPNRYGWTFIIFMLILAPQIGIMIFGPRSWTSPNALFLQATSQKIVVYSEILVLLFQAVGLWRLHGR
ncbi:MAG: hypothetical protein AAF573_06865 [Bacteroidota bacterium]